MGSTLPPSTSTFSLTSTANPSLPHQETDSSCAHRRLRSGIASASRTSHPICGRASKPAQSNTNTSSRSAWGGLRLGTYQQSQTKANSGWLWETNCVERYFGKLVGLVVTQYQYWMLPSTRSSIRSEFFFLLWTILNTIKTV